MDFLGGVAAVHDDCGIAFVGGEDVDGVVFVEVLDSC